ncbi:MAG: hypothetical protein M3495_04935 [Pseudomonadota bacterium]|nr:hypothetical protein [Pseudomonadota bacterium]
MEPDLVQETGEVTQAVRLVFRASWFHAPNLKRIEGRRKPALRAERSARHFLFRLRHPSTGRCAFGNRSVGNSMMITYCGHACFAVATDGKVARAAGKELLLPGIGKTIEL